MTATGTTSLCYNGVGLGFTPLPKYKSGKINTMQKQKQDIVEVDDSIILKIVMLFIAFFILYYDLVLGLTLIGVTTLFWIISHKITISTQEIEIEFFFLKITVNSEQIVFIRKTPNYTLMLLSVFPFITVVFPWRTNYAEFIEIAKTIYSKHFRQSHWL